MPISGITVGDALIKRAADYHAINTQLYQYSGLKQYVNSLLNVQTIKHELVASVIVMDGDKIALFPPVSGG